MAESPPKLPPLRDVIREHGLGARKSLGQHFLLDANLTLRIARAAGDLTGRHVIEVGPGPGGLTRGILENHPGGHLQASRLLTQIPDPLAGSAAGGSQLGIIAKAAVQATSQVQPRLQCR